jgi:outer membrane protein assembly factor BamB
LRSRRCRWARIRPSTRGICYCWDALTGKELWTSNTDGDARRAPALADGVLCFGTSEPDCVYGVAAATGSISWKIGMVNKVFYSPAIHRGVAYVSSGNLLYALSLESGSQLWSKSFAAEVGSPTLATYSQTLLPNVIRWVRDRGRVFFPHGPND